MVLPRKRISARTASIHSQRRWDSVASEWDRFVEEGHDDHRHLLHGPALLRVVGPVRGIRVLDVGCGQGYFSRVLARLGAKVTGVDWSQRMVATALRHERKEPLGIRYIRGDATKLVNLLGVPRFDLAVSCMAMMDMTHPDRVLKAVAKTLSPKGRLVFSITHPFADGVASRWSDPRVGHHGPRLIDNYFDERPAILEWKLRGTAGVMRAPQWHRTFATWSRFLMDAGFAITRIEEPRASASLARSEPRFEGCRRIPLYLIFEARPWSRAP